jgi:hypothetical protein
MNRQVIAGRPATTVARAARRVRVEIATGNVAGGLGRFRFWGLRSRSILDGYFNPLVLWYQWEYLRSPAKNLIFCRVSKIGNEMASLWVEQHNNTCLLVTVSVPSIPWLNIFAEFVAYRLSDSHTLPQLHSVLCLGWLKILKVNPLISPQWSQLRGNSFIKTIVPRCFQGVFHIGKDYPLVNKHSYWKLP